VLVKIAIIGGTGPEGSGLGFRWAAAGHEVLIGSRKVEKGKEVAVELVAKEPDFKIVGMDNETAVSQADVVVLAVPYSAQAVTLESVKEQLAGKLLITVVAPTGDKKTRVYRLESGLSAAEEAQQQLGEDVRVVAAFQNIGAHLLLDLDYQMNCDVLVCGAKAADKAIAIQIANESGLSGVNAVSLQNASVVEWLTTLLIFVNINQKVKDAGIRITGLDDS
jgi:NADPH-dependent F420 reductase